MSWDKSLTHHRDSLPIERVGDVGLSSRVEGHNVRLAVALRVAGDHPHLVALANLDGRHNAMLAFLTTATPSSSRSVKIENHDKVHFISYQGLQIQ